MDEFVNLSCGRVHYRIWGQGETLIFLHSNGASLHEAQPFAAILSARYRVIAWDMPGQGDSDPLHRHATIEQYSDWLDEFMSALQLDLAHVSGTSVGAVIAADFAARYPHRLRSAILVELASRTSQWWQQHWSMVESMFSIPAQDRPSVTRRYFTPVTDEFFSRCNIDRNKAGAKTMMDVMWAGRDYDVEKALPSIQAPALLLFGQHSPVIEPAPRLQAMLARAQLQTLANTGHFPMIDVPAAYCEAIDRFISSIQGH